MIVYPFYTVKSKFHPAKRRKLFFNSKTDDEIRQELRSFAAGRALGLNNKYEDRIGKIQKDLERYHKDISRNIPEYIKAGVDVELIIEQLLQGLDEHSKKSTQIRKEIDNEIVVLKIVVEEHEKATTLLKSLDEIDSTIQSHRNSLQELKKN